MTKATMTVLLRSTARSVAGCALAAWLGSASYASAQATTTTTTTTMSTQAIDANLVVRRNGGLVPNGTYVYANIADCGGVGGMSPTSTPNTFEFSATFTANVPIVELWLGVGPSEVCSTQANRLRTGGNATLPPVCTFLGTDTSNSRNPKIVVPGNQLFNQNSSNSWLSPDSATVPQSSMYCDALNGGVQYTVYFIPLATPTTTVNGSDPITVNNLSTLKAVFTPFTTRPAAPTSVSGQSGETEIGLSFKAPSSSMTLTTYRGYFDITGGGGSPSPTNIDGGIDAGNSPASTDGGVGDGAITLPNDMPGQNANMDASVDAGADASIDATSADGGSTAGAVSCGSNLLVEGQVAPPNPSNSEVRFSGNVKATSLKFIGLSDVPIGTNIAAGVVSIDPAGNESTLSQIVCIERVNTTGFIDSCDNTPGCRKGLTSCSLTPTQKDSPWSLLMGVFVLGALLVRRRRA